MMRSYVGGDDEGRSLTPRQAAVAAAGSGFVTRLLLQPLDVVKIRLQVTHFCEKLYGGKVISFCEKVTAGTMVSHVTERSSYIFFVFINFTAICFLNLLCHVRK